MYDGGSKLEQYTLEIRHVELDTWNFHTVTIQANSYKFDRFDPLQAAKLNPATDYAVRIKVRNIIGESDWSDYVIARTGIEPTRPGLLTFVASTRTTLDLEWDLLVGADTGGSDSNPLLLTYYHLYIDDGLGSPLKNHTTLPGTESTFRVEYLKSGLEYRF